MAEHCQVFQHLWMGFQVAFQLRELKAFVPILPLWERFQQDLQVWMVYLDQSRRQKESETLVA